QQTGFQRLLKNLLLMTAGGMSLAALLTLLGLYRVGNQFFGLVGALFQPAQPPAQVDVRSIVIQQIRGANELTTAVFAMEAVVPTRQDATVGGLVVGSTRLLYIAYGEVRAGVNLSELQATDVTIGEGTIVVQLPPPRILDRKIDVQRSQVYDYSRGFLGLGPDVAPELQTLAQQQSLEKITQAACTQGILQEANNRAILAVTQLLKTAGYEQVSVTTHQPTQGDCGGTSHSSGRFPGTH
ncbi:MAG: DUF4230 domain-containing protein, partial [Leptolyngbyaceae cyanobacterium bins.59]|nr:DUF4230 domain-containing protein [Leptolyngbyaceae cyanobacterium bins.59]